MDEVGRKVRVDLGMDLSGNSEITIKVVRPAGTSYSVNRAVDADIIVDDATTGQVSYETEAAYHDEVGEYLLQAEVKGVPNSGDKVYSPVIILTVEGHQF